MKLCAGQCRYLLTLFELSKNMKSVRSIDIANALSVTRPSVSRMLKCMSKLELIKNDYANCVILTPFGLETAKKLTAKFGTVKSFFYDILKLTEKEAYDQSIIFLANFPEETVEKLSRITKNTVNKRKNTR